MIIWVVSVYIYMYISYKDTNSKYIIEINTISSYFMYICVIQENHYLHVCIHIHTCIHIYTYIYTHIHIHIHRHTHVYIHSS